MELNENQQSWLRATEEIAALRLNKLINPSEIPARVQEIRTLLFQIIKEFEDQADIGNILRIASSIIPLSKKKDLMENARFKNAVAKNIEEIKIRKRVKMLLGDGEQHEDPLERILEELGIESLDKGDHQLVSELFELLKDNSEGNDRLRHHLKTFFVEARHTSLVSQLLEKTLREIRKERAKESDG